MNNKFIKKLLLIIMFMAIILFVYFKQEPKETITYSLYPYLINEDYYKEVIETKWSELHDDVKLEFVEYNCYKDGSPDNIDVIMYDSILESYFVENGYLQEINEDEINDIDDFFDYTIEGIKYDDKLYGIPAILCSNFFIYDDTLVDITNKKSINDLADYKGFVLMSLDSNSDSYYVDFVSDETGEYPIDDSYFSKDINLGNLFEYASCDYLDESPYTFADVYDENEAVGYFGYSETLSLIENRLDNTAIATLSLANNDNIQLYYVDAVGLAKGVDGEKRDLCLELMNLITSQDVMLDIGLEDNKLSYLIFPRDSFYSQDIRKYELYDDLYSMVKSEDNKVFRYPSEYFIKIYK